MIKETIKFLMELNEEVFHTHKDEFNREYFHYKSSARELSETKVPMPTVITLSTLAGVRDFYDTDLEKDADSVMVWVSSPFEVKIIGERHDAYQARRCYARSLASDTPFRFGIQMSIEKFIIDVNCFFVDSPVKEKLIEAVSHITKSDAVTADDDGTAQLVTSTAGAKLKRDKVEKFYELRPWRTFREVQQPKDKYLLRLHNAEDSKELPMVSLHSAGGDQWKNEAVELIHAHLTNIMPATVPVIR